MASDIQEMTITLLQQFDISKKIEEKRSNWLVAACSVALAHNILDLLKK